MPSAQIREPSGSDPKFFKGPFLAFIIFLPLFFLFIILILLAMQYKQLRAFVSPNPIVLATIPISKDAESKSLSKVMSFFSIDSSARISDTLSLSAEEINHLIRVSKPLALLKLDYHMEIEDTFLVARNSLPVQHLSGVLALLAKVLHVNGYLNSEIKGYASLEKNKISLVPVSATMNGIVAPVSVINRKGGIDPSEWIEDRELYARALSQLSEIKVRNGTLLFIKLP
jgi:hypothetical protein